jgi:hypothetical protein
LEGFYLFPPSCSALQNNNITGPITTKIGKLGKLKVLGLSRNHLYDEIPNTVDNLESLEYL